MSYELAELKRRMENIIRHGVIAEVDYPRARVRVQYDIDDNGAPVSTDWRPWLTRRASYDSDWWAPELGEQVLLLSPSGDLALAMVLPAIYQNAHPAPMKSASKHRVNYQDGSWLEYDRAAHTLTVSVNGGDIVLNVTGKLDATIGGDANVSATGQVIVSGNVINLDGVGGGAGKGVVNGDCVCAFTGAPHPQISTSVKATP